jgi:hypothetical protein
VKKTFAVIAAVLFVLSFAASAFAIHAEIPAETQSIVAKGSTQITIGGEIRVRGWYYDNLAPFNTAAVPGTPQESNSKANYDQRVRLFIDAQVTPNVTGRIAMETGNSDGATTDIYSWGRLNQKPNGLTTLLEAWIQYKGTGLFGFNSGIKVGHMPLKLSEGQFFDNTQFGDDAIVFFMDPMKELHIGLLTIKASESGVAGNGNANGLNTNDLDAYVGLFTYKIAPTHTLGMNYTYINESDVSLKFQNLGIHANGTAGNFGYRAEVDFQFGSVGGSNSLMSSKMDFGGWAAFLAMNYKMNPVNLRASFAYGSGDDGNGRGDPGSKNSEFQTLVGTIQHSTFIYDYRSRTAAQNQVLNPAGNAGTGSGIANTTYYNIGADWTATKDLTFIGDLYYLRASKDTWNRGGPTEAFRASKNIGWELDATMKYQIAKNLTYELNAGYLWTGSFYRWSEDTNFVGNEKANTTILRNVLTLSF